jgi:hypothetical protein
MPEASARKRDSSAWFIALIDAEAELTYRDREGTDGLDASKLRPRPAWRQRERLATCAARPTATLGTAHAEWATVRYEARTAGTTRVGRRRRSSQSMEGGSSGLGLEHPYGSVITAAPSASSSSGLLAIGRSSPIPIVAKSVSRRRVKAGFACREVWVLSEAVASDRPPLLV